MFTDILGGWENSHPTPAPSALELLRAAFSPHCYSLSTQMTAPLKTPLWWHHSHRSHPGRRRVCLQTRGWAAGCLVQSQQPGAEHAQNCRDDCGLQEKPPCSPPTHHHEQHCGCSGVIQVPGNHHLSGPEVGHSHWLHREKGPAEVVLPSSTEKVQPATGAYDTVLLCCYWVGSVLFYNCMVWVSQQIRYKKTAADC